MLALIDARIHGREGEVGLPVRRGAVEAHGRVEHEVGQPGVSLTQVMVAAEKSSIAFEAMTQVRNKLVDAYKEIMNMPV